MCFIKKAKSNWIISAHWPVVWSIDYVDRFIGWPRETFWESEIREGKVRRRQRAGVRLRRRREAERGREGSREAGFAFSGSWSRWKNKQEFFVLQKGWDINQTLEVDTWREGRRRRPWTKLQLLLRYCKPTVFEFLLLSWSCLGWVPNTLMCSCFGALFCLPCYLLRRRKGSFFYIKAHKLGNLNDDENLIHLKIRCPPKMCCYSAVIRLSKLQVCNQS